MRQSPEAGNLLNVSWVTSPGVLCNALTLQNWVIIWAHPKRFHTAVEELEGSNFSTPNTLNPSPQKDGLMVSA